MNKLPRVDIVYASIDYSLPGNVELLQLLGTATHGTGNAQNNTIYTNALSFAGFVLDGGGGVDTMYGGRGNDLYFVDNAGDSIREFSGEGIDEIRTSLAVYSLAALPNVENLSASSSIAHDFSGNASSNVMTGGNGDDVLRSSARLDRTQGGQGNDTHYVDDSGDVVRVVDVHLEHVRGRGQLPRNLLRQANAPADVREENLRALLLCHLRDRERNAVVGQDAGDEQLLAVEAHASGASSGC